MSHPIPAVAAVVYWPSREAILLVKKGPAKREPGWSNVGGKQEKYESSLVAAWRELAEEAGPDLNPAKLAHLGILGLCEDVDPGGDKHYVTLVHMFAVRPGAEPRAVNAEPHQHEAVGWFPVTGLPANMADSFHRATAGMRRGLGDPHPDLVGRDWGFSTEDA